MEEFKPQDTFEINDLETLKVIADPLRSQIFEVLIPQALTVNQVAEKLGHASSKLYYHINLLEKHGLIQVVETNLIGNILEKRYRAVSPILTVDHELFSFANDQGKENINTVLTSTIDTTREDLLRSLQARAYALEQGAEQLPRRVIINRILSRIPEDRAEEFQARIASLLKEFEASDQDPPPGEELQTYALTLVFYPSFYFYNSDHPSPEK